MSLKPKESGRMPLFTEGNFDDLPGHNWIAPLLIRLNAIWPTDRTLSIKLVEPDHEALQLYDGYAEAVCSVQDDRITLYFREHMEETDENISIICHEYAHAVLAPFTAGAGEHPTTIEAYRTDPYVREVERSVRHLGGLLEFAAQYDAVELREE